MATQTATGSLAQIFEDGYAPEVISALIGAIDAYGYMMVSDDFVACRVDADNIASLTRLLRAVLTDSFGIDIA